MKVDVLQLDGSSAGTVELNSNVFEVSSGTGSIYYKIRNELANNRQGTVATKGRADVHYSKRKPWRQKGTGRARAGSRSSPIWVGGGTVFGPTPRDYSYTLPVKIKRLAFRSLFSQKVAKGNITILSSINCETGKTKDLKKNLEGVNPDLTPSILIIKDNDVLLKRAAKNLPWLKVFVYSQLRFVDVFYGKKIFITKGAVEKLNTFLLKGTQDAS